MACMKSAILLLATLLVAVPSDAQDISIAIVAPSANEIVANSVAVKVNVSSTYELSFVRATISTRTTNLIFTGGSWTNVLNTTMFSRGSYTLIIFAEDVFGNTGQVQRVIRVDRPPVLSVAAPLNGTVARSN